MAEDFVHMLHDTLAICKQGYYYRNGKKIDLKLSRKEMEAVRVFFPEELEKLKHFKDFPHVYHISRCGCSCENKDSFTLAREREKDRWLFDPKKTGKEILVLNLANPVRPGGGVRHGARAQEEDLCRKSSLLLSLESPGAKPYYDYHYQLYSNMASNAIIITPKVEIIKDEKGQLLEESVVVAVMSCAAPMVAKGFEGLSHEEYRKLLYDRISGMLRCAAHLGSGVLFLGAFGCGAFGNDAKVVSDVFYKAMKEFRFDTMADKDMFRSISFAVLSRDPKQYNYKEFYRNFGGGNYYRDLDWEQIHWKEKQREPVFFWLPQQENGCFSNAYKSLFTVDGVAYCHVEQYLMAQKAKLFGDTVRYAEILQEQDPMMCKYLGRKVNPFVPQVWDGEKYRILKKGIRAKFSQNPGLWHMLIATGDATLAKASAKDPIWGIGLSAQEAQKTNPDQWPGENLLGKALMEVREELRGKA